MDWIERLNEAIRYIEENLTGKIEYEKLGQIAYYIQDYGQRSGRNELSHRNKRGVSYRWKVISIKPGNRTELFRSAADVGWGR